MELMHESKSSDKNSFGLLTFQPGLLLNNLKYTPATTVSFAGDDKTILVSGNFITPLGF